MGLEVSGKGIAYEDIILSKQLHLYNKDELFLKKFLDLYTQLEQQFLSEIINLEKQAKNTVKMSSAYGQLSNIQTKEKGDESLQ